MLSTRAHDTCAATRRHLLDDAVEFLREYQAEWSDRASSERRLRLASLGPTAEQHAVREFAAANRSAWIGTVVAELLAATSHPPRDDRAGELLPPSVQPHPTSPGQVSRATTTPPASTDEPRDVALLAELALLGLRHRSIVEPLAAAAWSYGT